MEKVAAKCYFKPMKAIAGDKITFAKADLSHFSDGQMKVLYVFAHILNRSKLLETQIFSQWHAATDTKHSRIEQDAALFGVFEFLLLLAGELKEGWEAIRSCYYGTQLSKTLNHQLPKDVQAILKRLPNHFTGTSIITQLRNDFSYHHSPDKILTTARLLANDDPHIAYLFGDDNNYFDYATKLRIAAVAELLGLSDWRKVIDHLMPTVMNEVYQDMSSTLNAILVALVTTINHTRESVELPYVPSNADISGNYFFSVI